MKPMTNASQLFLMGVVVLVVGACVPVSGQVRGPSAGGDERPTAPKILTLADQFEITAIVGQGASPAGGSAGEIPYLFHDDLLLEVSDETYVGQLAVEAPSVDKGTWRIHPDGTMDTVWKLRPNVFWHDGTQFTSADLMFTFRLAKDPQSGFASRYASFMGSAEAPDPLTFILHWTVPFSAADRVALGRILPRHLVEEIYNAGPEKLMDSTFRSTDFVGLGPYRLSEWERGSHIIGSRFDQYYQGRPKLDQVIVRFFSDPNVIVANVLSGVVDVASWGVDVDAAFDVQQRWEGTKNRILYGNTQRAYYMETQYRSEFAKPRDAWSSKDVRQAFYQAIDRKTIVEAVTHGLAPLADSNIHPDHKFRSAVEPYVANYPYDPRRAEVLLDQAGWTRGADGVRVNARTGERLEVELWGHPDSTRTKLATIIADFWKAVGAAPIVTIIAAARLTDFEYVYHRPAWWMVTPPFRCFYDNDKLATSQIPEASTRWSGINYGGYSNPALDDLYTRWHVTIDSKEQVAIQQQFVKAQFGDLAVLPLYWQISPILIRENVTGLDKTVANHPTSFIFDWGKS